ncbi:NADH dehydrogenase (quinone) [Alkaliphilus metalliredigens QYMF]|uniref:NADH dehydrogenase (Quinone) n=1 Tax=Alkaliphilus metalliredigens (strain QYMF) TaxID=293826 RepID=A6TVL5_ALKMQ|nr:monovalent cation/H+ antiporter subunit D family protein [Alkaliphilus metalliredigens]ABR50233.1 NADH dehydrogenase (quinone) [Alkaliphilus metalliredigens QYMF]
MSSIHFPVYILLLLLISAILIPLKKGDYDDGFKWEMMGVLGLAWALSLSLLIFVLRDQSFTYTFGQWNPTIGIEFVVDEFSALMTLVVLSVATLIIIYSLKDIEHEILKEQFFSYYTLIFLLLFSMIGMIFTNDLFNLYVFMEILSLTSCGIISIKRKKENLMASFKYLMLGAIGSVSILMGIALLYMVTGHLNMTAAYEVITQVWQSYPRNILIALGFILTGFGIKAAIFPLHIWLPDAHSNAPTPSSALLSGLVVKVYVFAIAKILFRVLGQDIVQSIGVTEFITYFAVLSMIMGSVFAIGQTDIKRLLAYSSVAQIGYIFLGLGLATELGFSAGLFHVITHALMKSALFLSAGAIIYQTGKRDIRDLDGIGYQMPITMGVFSVAALGMIGIPGLNGFMSKWYLSLAVLEADKPVFLIMILISSFLNAIYYLPIIIAAFLKESNERDNVMVLDRLPKTMMYPMVIIAIGCVVMGFFPHIVMDVVERAVPTFLFINN